MALSNTFISFSTKKPIPLGKFEAIPTFEAWALWHVPNASFINISPKLAQYLPNSLSFELSNFPFKSSNLVFSIRSISPLFKLFISSSNIFPLVSSTKIISLSNNSLNLKATGSNVFFSLSDSYFTLPKCDINITFAFFSKQ